MPTMLERIAWKRKKWSENGEAWSELVDLLLSPELEAELNELKRLKAGLPKTDDGVTILPGMNIVVRDGVDGDIIRDDVGVFSIECDNADEFIVHIRDADGQEWVEYPCSCFSSRAAAEAALLSHMPTTEEEVRIAEQENANDPTPLPDALDLREAVRWMHRNAIGWRTEFPKSIRDAAEAALKKEV